MAEPQPLYDNRLNGEALIGSAIAAPPLQKSSIERRTLDLDIRRCMELAQRGGL